MRKIIVVQKLNCIKTEKEKESYPNNEAKDLLIWVEKEAGDNSRSV